VNDFKHKDEQRLSRQQAAERLTDVAYALTAGGRLNLHGDEEVAVSVADQVMLKRESKAKGGHVELALELSWSMPSPSPPADGQGLSRPGLTDGQRAFLDDHRVGVLATITSTGKPRQSVVYYARDGDRLLISTESKRLKAREVQRSGWASLCVLGHEQPYPSAVYSGRAEIHTEDIGPHTAQIMQRIAGMEQPPEPQSDEALAAVDRVVLAITVERVSAAN
jgi:PPOX class probable F420-dependent enzyme